MRAWVGTSGYNYPEWKGTFYPADLASAKMLPYYAGRFSTPKRALDLFLRPFCSDLEAYKVSRIVNSPANDVPDCVERAR